MPGETLHMFAKNPQRSLFWVKWKCSKMEADKWSPLLQWKVQIHTLTFAAPFNQLFQSDTGK